VKIEKDRKEMAKVEKRTEKWDMLSVWDLARQVLPLARRSSLLFKQLLVKLPHSMWMVA
jgi:hypothetical protein